MVPQSPHSGSARMLAVLATFYNSAAMDMYDIYTIESLSRMRGFNRFKYPWEHALVIWILT